MEQFVSSIKSGLADTFKTKHSLVVLLCLLICKIYKSFSMDFYGERERERDGPGFDFACPIWKPQKLNMKAKDSESNQKSTTVKHPLFR